MGIHPRPPADAVSPASEAGSTTPCPAPPRPPQLPAARAAVTTLGGQIRPRVLLYQGQFNQAYIGVFGVLFFFSVTKGSAEPSSAGRVQLPRGESGSAASSGPAATQGLGRQRARGRKKVLENSSKVLLTTFDFVTDSGRSLLLAPRRSGQRQARRLELPGVFFLYEDARLEIFRCIHSARTGRGGGSERCQRGARSLPIGSQRTRRLQRIPRDLQREPSPGKQRKKLTFKTRIIQKKEKPNLDVCFSIIFFFFFPFR